MPSMAMKKPSKPKATLAAAHPIKVRQPHGGALYAGGVPGHSGARAGRRRSDVKELLLGGAAQAVPVLLAHLEGRDAVLAQSAADKLLRYGVGPHRDDGISRDEIHERLQATIELIRRLTPMDLGDEILRQMRELWK
jgi:hypothetical protein